MISQMLFRSNWPRLQARRRQDKGQIPGVVQSPLSEGRGIRFPGDDQSYRYSGRQKIDRELLSQVQERFENVLVTARSKLAT